MDRMFDQYPKQNRPEDALRQARIDKHLRSRGVGFNLRAGIVIVNENEVVIQIYAFNAPLFNRPLSFQEFSENWYDLGSQLSGEFKELRELVTTWVREVDGAQLIHVEPTGEIVRREIVGESDLRGEKSE